MHQRSTVAPHSHRPARVATRETQTVAIFAAISALATEFWRRRRVRIEGAAGRRLQNFGGDTRAARAACGAAVKPRGDGNKTSRTHIFLLALFHSFVM